MNDQQHLLEESEFTFRGFFSKLLHHFWYGGDTVDRRNPRYSNPLDLPFHRFSFPLEYHTGPISDAVSDSLSLSRSLFVYIYCRDNSDTIRVNELLSRPQISDAISSFYVFYPVEATSPEGWRLLTELFFFQALPLLALVRPRGNSLQQSQVFVKHEGVIGETALLSYLTMEHQHNGAAIIAQQDEEFRRAVEEAEANQQTAEQIQRQAMLDDQQRERTVREEYDAIPIPQTGQGIMIKFLFPDGVARTREFPQNGTVRMIFAFVRNFESPHQFAIFAGFPTRQIEESDSPISSICTDRQFIVHIDEID